MGRRYRVSRRRALQGLGVSLALPWLESLRPAAALAAGPGAEKNSLPLRMAFLSVPNGIHMEDWTPQAEGFGFALPATPARDCGDIFSYFFLTSFRRSHWLNMLARRRCAPGTNGIPLST
jgi:hypothetical protein